MRAKLPQIILALIVIGTVLGIATLMLIALKQDWQDALLWVLAAVLIGSALLVVTMRDIIRCGLAMIVCFLALAGIYTLMGVPLLGAAQVIVYIGAISVLILFAIMLTQAGDANLPAPFHRQVPIAVVISLALIGLVGWAVIQTDWPAAAEAAAAAVEDIANAIFTEFALPFEIISLLLLVAIIGAIYLTRRPEEDERAN